LPDATGTFSLAHVSVSSVNLEDDSAPAQDLAIAATTRMLSGNGRSKLRRAKTMQRDIDAAVLESVGLVIYNRKRMGKKMISHANYVLKQCSEDGGLDQSNMSAIRNMLQEGSALILQHAWRIKKSSRRARTLKTEQKMLRLTGAAAIIQGSWRIRQARVKALAAKQQRERDEASRCLQRTLRGFLARRRLDNLKKSMHPLTYVLTFQGVDSFAEKVGDPYLVMSVYNLESRAAALVTASALQPGRWKVLENVPPSSSSRSLLWLYRHQELQEAQAWKRNR
jgi:hypothetical protein